ncbi:MAG TPA: Gfo/Idh/MocA family oxidoreductase [Limnochordia bacterium]|nr:Gfo/Idh/MocA family oxidoreductase [Limnochordia bacterium]
MRFALIGTTGHVDYYAPMLAERPHVEVAGIAKADPSESLERMQKLPGVTERTRAFDSWETMLDEVKPDAVQICARTQPALAIITACAARGIHIMTEKPLAADLESLHQLYAQVSGAGVVLAPLHGYRRFPALAALQAAVRGGRIGEPIQAASQISYRWGVRRPDYMKSRAEFPGVVPFIGIHIVDWLLWIWGDVFVDATGWESYQSHPDYLGCASQASFALRSTNGGIASATLDFARPLAAPSHGDERVRIVGTQGVGECRILDPAATLLTDPDGPIDLPEPDAPHWYSTFIDAATGAGACFIGLEQAFRVSEIALLVQQAIDRGETKSLRNSPFITP